MWNYFVLRSFIGTNHSIKDNGVTLGDKDLEIKFSTTLFWAIFSNRHAILARNTDTLSEMYHLPLSICSPDASSCLWIWSLDVHDFAFVFPWKLFETWGCSHKASWEGLKLK